MEKWIEEPDYKVTRENRAEFDAYCDSLRLGKTALSQVSQPNQFYGDTPVVLQFVDQPHLDDTTQDTNEQ